MLIKKPHQIIGKRGGIFLTSPASLDIPAGEMNLKITSISCRQKNQQFQANGCHHLPVGGGFPLACRKGRVGHVLCKGGQQRAEFADQILFSGSETDGATRLEGKEQLGRSCSLGSERGILRRGKRGDGRASDSSVLLCPSRQTSTPGGGASSLNNRMLLRGVCLSCDKQRPSRPCLQHHGAE